MPISPYVRSLREHVGPARLLLPCVTALVYDAEGRLLLVRQAGWGIWTTPGGAMDPGETPADAVVREAWEETGLWVEPLRVMGVYGGEDFVVRYPNGDEAEYAMFVFECRVLGGTARPDGQETAEVRYFGLDEALTLPVPHWLGIVLPTFFARPEAPHFHPPRWRPPAE